MKIYPHRSALSAVTVAAILTLSALATAQQPAQKAPASPDRPAKAPAGSAEQSAEPAKAAEKLRNAVPVQDTPFSLTVYSTADPATFDPKGNNNGQNFYQPQQLPGYGVVREKRPIDLKAGVNTVRFTDVAAGIDPTTVSFLSLTDPAGTGVLEQSFEYDLVNSQKLLQKYLDQKVVVTRPAGEGKSESITGTLLSAEGQLVVRVEDGSVQIINGYSGIQLASAKGLITKPTLVWQLQAARAGKHDALITYQTDGLTWRADYNVLLNEKDTAADIGAWVTVVNRSGASYPETRLKLVAGDVQRLQPQQLTQQRMVRDFAASNTESNMGFQEKSFFEYHLYTLGRTTTLPDNSVKQIELFEAKVDVPVEKIFIYYGLPAQYRPYVSAQPMTDRNFGTETNKKVDTYISIDNREENDLGIPLPAGRVRVYKRDDADKTNEFIGEDVIEHTPKDEKILIKLGSAFDIVGERKQTNFTVDANGHVITESFEIKVRNHKKEPVEVIVKENLFRWFNWEITDSNTKWEKQDYRTIHFPVNINPDAEKVVTYTVKYTW